MSKKCGIQCPSELLGELLVMQSKFAEIDRTQPEEIH